MKILELKQLREVYLKTSKEELTDFDKNFFFVSAGIFAFTVTFIKDIVNIRSAHWIIFLLLSWGFFAVSIGLIILAFYISSIDNTIISNKIEGIISQHPNAPDDYELGVINLSQDNGWKFHFRRLSILCFLLGLLFLSVFLIINFYWGNDEITAKGKTQTQNPLVPSSKNPMAPITNISKFDTTIKRIDSTTIMRIDSTFLIVKPDTIFIQTGGCSCPPNSRVCTRKCRKRR